MQKEFFKVILTICSVHFLDFRFESLNTMQLLWNSLFSDSANLLTAGSISEGHETKDLDAVFTDLYWVGERNGHVFLSVLWLPHALSNQIVTLYVTCFSSKKRVAENIDT